MAYTFFDVETPNRHNDSICSIGVIRANEKGSVEYKNHFLINPLCEFDQINISIHGIHPSDVLDAPDFFKVWKGELSEVFSDAIWVAHNASFDIRVLGKCLSRYDEGFPAGAQYMDTIELSSQLFSGVSNYKLPTVCEYLGIPLTKHHDAMADTLGCFGIYLEAVNRFDQIELPIRSVIPTGSAISSRHQAKQPSANSAAMKSLIDQVMMMEADGVIAYGEAELLKAWVGENSSNIPTSISSKLLESLDEVLLDGAIDPSEEIKLHDLFSKLLYPTEGNSCSGVSGKVFCLTGEFDYGDKQDVINAIKADGGDCVKSNPTKACDYVVVGNKGSDLYAFDNYGSKVKHALEMQSRGHRIQVISEDELIKML